MQTFPNIAKWNKMVSKTTEIEKQFYKSSNLHTNGAAIFLPTKSVLAGSAILVSRMQPEPESWSESAGVQQIENMISSC